MDTGEEWAWAKGGTSIRIERHIRNQGIPSPSLSPFSFPNTPFVLSPIYLFHCLPMWTSFPFFSVQKVGWLGLSQPVSGKWQLSPSTNFKFSGERLQWAQLGAVISPRSIHPGTVHSVEIKCKCGFQTHYWDLEKKFLEEGAHRLGSNP